MSTDSPFVMLLVIMGLLVIGAIGWRAAQPYQDPDPFRRPVTLTAAQIKAKQIQENVAFNMWWSTVLAEERQVR